MAWFPDISDYSPQKVKYLLKQQKIKQRPQRRVERKKFAPPQEPHEVNETPENDGEIDLFV